LSSYTYAGTQTTRFKGGNSLSPVHAPQGDYSSITLCDETFMAFQVDGSNPVGVFSNVSNKRILEQPS